MANLVVAAPMVLALAGAVVLLFLSAVWSEVRVNAFRMSIEGFVFAFACFVVVILIAEARAYLGRLRQVAVLPRRTI